MKLRYVVFLGAVLLTACNSDLGRNEAASLLYDHYLTAGPHLSDEVWFSSENILVESVLQPSAETRKVRFRFVRKADTTNIQTVSFTRSDDGWAITNYGPSALEFVASAVSEYRYSLYEDLLPALAYLRGKARDSRLTEEAPPNESTAALLARIRRAQYSREHAPTRAELISFVISDSLPIDLISWGVFPDDEPVLIWVRDNEDQDRICAQAFNDDYMYILSDDFDWVDPDRYSQCRGDVAPYWLLIQEDLVMEIIASGGIWLD